MNEGDHATSNGGSSAQPSSSQPAAASSPPAQLEVLMEQEFVLYPKSTSATLQLTNDYIKITKSKSKSAAKYIYLDDVIGCHVLEGNTTTPSKHFICVFYYPMKKKLFSKTTRHRCTRSFGIQCNPQAQENERQANKWKLAIKLIISGKKLTANDVDEINRSSQVSEVRRRNFLVYVNPFSGSKCADVMYKDHLKKLLAEAEIDHKCIKTEKHGHAHDHVKEVDLTVYDAIIIVSGDGLIHEVINGLMQRADWSTAIRTPIGVVPGGSGNALAAAIAYASFGKVKTASVWELLFDCLLVIAKFRLTDMALMDVTQHHQSSGDTVTSSPVHVTSSNDDERCHGDDQQSAAVVMDTATTTTTSSTPLTSSSSGKKFFSFLNIGWGFVADVDIESERLRLFGGTRFLIGSLIRVVKLRKYDGVIEYLPSMTSHFKPINPDCISTYDAAAGGDHNPPMTSFAAPSCDVKDDWLKLKDEFIFVMPIYLSHIGGDMFAMPNAKLDEPVIYLLCLRYGISRWRLIDSLLQFESGGHIDAGGEFMSVIPCRAVKITPLSKHGDGHLTSDGEVLPYKPITVSTTSVSARVICYPTNR